MTVRLSTWLACLAASLCLFGLARPSAGADKKVKLVGPGRAFGLHMRAGQWGVLQAIIRNPSDEPRRTRLILTAVGSEQGRRSYSCVLDVPPRSARQLAMGCRTPELTGSDLAAGKRNELVRLYDAKTGQDLDTDEMLSDVPGDRTNLIGWCGRGLFSFIKQIESRPFRQVSLVSSPVRPLPDRWYGYATLRMMILSDMDPSVLLDSQVDAILSWVRQGGALLIAPGPRRRHRITGRLTDAAGVAILSSHEEARLAADGADGKNRFSVELDPAQTMIELVPDGAAVLWRANHLPLLTARRVGEGWVFVLAVPTGALKHETAATVWDGIGDRLREQPVVAGDRFPQASQAELARIAGRRSPSAKAPVTVLVALAAATLVLGLALRFLGRPERLWLILLPAGIVISVALVAYARTIRVQPRLSFLALASDIDGDVCHVRQVSAYYSPTEHVVDFSSGSASGLVDVAAGASAGPLGATRITSGRTMRLKDIRVADSTRSAQLETPVALPGRLETDLAFAASGLAGKITNHLGFDVVDAVVIARGKAYAVGDLPAGKTTTVTVSDTPLLGGTFIAKSVRTPEDRLRDRLLGVLTAPGGLTRKPSNDAILAGWTRHMLPDPLPGVELESRGWTLVTMPLRAVGARPGEEVSIPFGLADWDITRVRLLTWNPFTRTFESASRPGGLRIRIAPPNGIRLADPRAVLNIHIRAGTYQMEVLGAGGTSTQPAEWTMIRTVDRPSGAYEIPIDDLDRFRDEAGGYHLIVQVAPRGPKKHSGTALWRIESLDVTLKGRAK